MMPIKIKIYHKEKTIIIFSEKFFDDAYFRIAEQIWGEGHYNYGITCHPIRSAAKPYVSYMRKMHRLLGQIRQENKVRLSAFLYRKAKERGIKPDQLTIKDLSEIVSETLPYEQDTNVEKGDNWEKHKDHKHVLCPKSDVNICFDCWCSQKCDIPDCEYSSIYKKADLISWKKQ